MTGVATPRSLDFLDPRLKPLCDAYLRFAQVPGASIAIVARDRGYHYGYGVKSLSTGGPVTATTAFNVGSCSKAFVSVCVGAFRSHGLQLIPGTWLTLCPVRRDATGLHPAFNL